MINLFFNSSQQFKDIASVIFKTLGIDNYQEGESSNVLGGYYYSYPVFGVEIKLEQNSYDYEDKYRYMLHVKEYSLSGINVEASIIDKVADIIVRLIKDNLSIQVAIEKNNELIIL